MSVPKWNDAHERAAAVLEPSMRLPLKPFGFRFYKAEALLASSAKR
jgi:hypothetical protein